MDEWLVNLCRIAQLIKLNNVVTLTQKGKFDIKNEISKQYYNFPVLAYRRTKRCEKYSNIVGNMYFMEKQYVALLVIISITLKYYPISRIWQPRLWKTGNNIVNCDQVNYTGI